MIRMIWDSDLNPIERANSYFIPVWSIFHFRSLSDWGHFQPLWCDARTFDRPFGGRRHVCQHANVTVLSFPMPLPILVLEWENLNDKLYELWQVVNRISRNEVLRGPLFIENCKKVVLPQTLDVINGLLAFWFPWKFSWVHPEYFCVRLGYFQVRTGYFRVCLGYFRVCMSTFGLFKSFRFEFIIFYFAKFGDIRTDEKICDFLRFLMHILSESKNSDHFLLFAF